MKSFILSLVLLVSQIALADSTYYPQDIQDKINKSLLKDEAMKEALNLVLTSEHQKNASGAPDTLGCKAGSGTCYSHVNLGYNGARKVMFGQIHLKNDGNGFYVEDVYCQKKFAADAKVGPNAIPNQNKINCEHTWPQSKFSKNYPAEIQKADLNHLYPTDSRANSIRGNYDFADVSSDNGNLSTDDCLASKSGSAMTIGGDNYFEPPTNHKGNVARALFYFSVRYKISMPKTEEDVLRKWNEIDPIDQDEINRNEIVYSAQKNRNPFIDYPNLVNLISRF